MKIISLVCLFRVFFFRVSKKILTQSFITVCRSGVDDMMGTNAETCA